MKKEITIELLPWFHDQQFYLHDDVLRYLQRVPQKSILGLEESPPGLKKIRGIMNEEKLQKLQSPVFHPLVGSQPRLAILEVFFELQKRKVRIAPIESDAWRKKRPEDRDMNDWREQYMAGRITKLIEDAQKKNLGRIYVLVGSGHIVRLFMRLKKMGLHPTVNTTFARPVLRRRLRNLIRRYFKEELEKDRKHRIIRTPKGFGKPHRNRGYFENIEKWQKRELRRRGLLARKITHHRG